MRTASIVFSFLAAISLHAGTNELVGTWELIDASPVSFNSSDPRGIINHKLYYTADGKMFIIAPDRKLEESNVPVSYTFDDGVRTLTLPGGEVHESRVAFAGDRMRVRTEDGVMLTYRRMAGDRPYDRAIEPRSLEVLDLGDEQRRAPRYDSTDYSKQPLALRIRGIWEVMKYTKVKFQPPAEGFPNDKYVITADEVAMISPVATRIEGESRGRYRLEGNTMVVDDGSRWEISFNKWQRLVMKRDDAELTLRLVSKDTKTIPPLPIRIVLYETE